jgi:hypothetical protein
MDLWQGLWTILMDFSLISLDSDGSLEWTIPMGSKGSLTRVMGHPKQAKWESVAHVRSKVPRAHIFPFAALSPVAFSALASLLAKGAVELAGSTVQAIVRDWAPGAEKW